MKLKHSLEEAICILLILAQVDNQIPMKGTAISQQLGVSDSYTKKILRKLVLGGLVSSGISKGGGFRLAQTVEAITLLDVYHAVEGEESYFHSLHLASQVYPKAKGAQVDANLALIFQQGQEKLSTHFASFSLADIIRMNDSE